LGGAGSLAGNLWGCILILTICYSGFNGIY